MKTILEIAIDVTAEQISKCTKVWGHGGEEYFLVENSKGECDEHGIIEYEVHYDASKGFTCTCEAGRRGFSGCRNYCWHVRASCTKELETRGITRNDQKFEIPAITPIEIKWDIPVWMLNAPVAPHMKNAPRYR